MASILLPRQNSLILLLPICLAVISRAQECDPQCKTANCDSDGVCICEVPKNSSMLQGDRPFLGGPFCDIPRTMCDGTNSFWCENGICNEIIQGENYTCTCNEGFAGEHCELEGIPCGNSFCYHSGQCVEAEGLCDCPAAWRGSPDCSSPSKNSPTPIVDSEPVKVAPKGNSSLNTPAVLMGIFVAVAVSGGLICLVSSLRKRSAATTEFHKLQQVQMRGFIEEDEEAFSRAPLSKAEIA